MPRHPADGVPRRPAFVPGPLQRRRVSQRRIHGIPMALHRIAVIESKRWCPHAYSPPIGSIGLNSMCQYLVPVSPAPTRSLPHVRANALSNTVEVCPARAQDHDLALRFLAVERFAIRVNHLLWNSKVRRATTRHVVNRVDSRIGRRSLDVTTPKCRLIPIAIREQRLDRASTPLPERHQPGQSIAVANVRVFPVSRTMRWSVVAI